MQTESPANKKQRKLRLYPPAAPLDFVAIAILIPLPKTKSRTKYIGVVTDRYSKASKAIRTTKRESVKIGSFLMEHWVGSYVILSTVQKDNGP